MKKRMSEGGEGLQVRRQYLHDLADQAESLHLSTCGHMLEARGHSGAVQSPI